jgi:GGDEF domain-containing protein
MGLGNLGRNLKCFAERVSGKSERRLEERIGQLEQEKKKLESEKEELKGDTIDALTGLPREGPFNRLLETAIRTGLYRKIVETDTAAMKYANTDISELAGDELIKHTAGILRKFPLTRRDCLARIGGDEFGYVFTCDNNPTAIENLNKRVESAVHNIYNSQKEINEKYSRAGKHSPLQGIELCIGVGIVDPNDEPASTKGKPLNQTQMQDMIRHLTREVGDKRAGADKRAQGIYDRHPEYDRKPKINTEKCENCIYK